MRLGDTAANLQAIDDAQDRTICVRIDCAGGRADDALRIAEALLRHKWRVVADIVGRCSSSAIFFALAADLRTIEPDGCVMIHRAARCCTYEQFKAMQSLATSLKAGAAHA
ncbi:ATP-dependent Clp protease proteolytic subunit [Bradyrhizobium sp. Bra78]|uniref:ATP-dependent Clp protease proteolytic subunit n=1 Tax=Bradyrhizobium sp. Bra78 TaxID=2926010 RepID=UPI0021C5E2CC|nr:ATP-dependent Clp protease proteolytic subunit [Bradyrhizobium sp. Bra78]